MFLHCGIVMFMRQGSRESFLYFLLLCHPGNVSGEVGGLTAWSHLHQDNNEASHADMQSWSWTTPEYKYIRASQLISVHPAMIPHLVLCCNCHTAVMVWFKKYCNILTYICNGVFTLYPCRARQLTFLKQSILEAKRSCSRAHRHSGSNWKIVAPLLSF